VAKSRPSPEDIVKAWRSYTGKFLGPVLARASEAAEQRFLFIVVVPTVIVYG
jgi:hypothetical protein